MKSLFTKIISALTILTLCVGLTACKTNRCAGEHTWKLTSTTATCFDGGVETYTCEKCKETKTENVEAYGHNFVLTSRTEPTCKTNGEEVKKCSRCGFESKQTLLIVDHDYQVKSTTPSTCTVKGSQLLECSMCHETKTETLELKDHTFELVNTTPSTCVTHGSNQYKCKDCTETKSEELPLGEHKYETQTVEATCFTHGGTVEKCSVCQDQKPVNETPLLTHNFGTDGYCEHCGIYETLFDEDLIFGEKNDPNAYFDYCIDYSNEYGLYAVGGGLYPRFKNDNSIPNEYWKTHTVCLTLSIIDKENRIIDSNYYISTTISSNNEEFGKLTIQEDVENQDCGGNRFFIFTNRRFSSDSLKKGTSFKIEISCEGYKTIEKTYNLSEA